MPMMMTVMTITLPVYDDGDGDGANIWRLGLRLIYHVLRQQDNDDDEKYDNDSNSRLRELTRTLFKI